MLISISGELYEITRRELIQGLRDMGHHVGDHVSDRTNYLICNNLDISHRKVRDALKYNVPIITENEALYMFFTYGL